MRATQLELVPWGPHSFGYPIAAVLITIEPTATPRPRATLRKRGGEVHAGTHEPDEYTDWLQEAADAISQWWGERQRLAFPVAVDVTFYSTAPARKKSVDVAGWEVPFTWDDGGMWDLGPEDIDNYSKAILDAMRMAGVFLDDRLVVELAARKVWALERPHIEVRVYNAGLWSERRSFLQRAKALLSSLLGGR